VALWREEQEPGPSRQRRQLQGGQSGAGAASARHAVHRGTLVCHRGCPCTARGPPHSPPVVFWRLALAGVSPSSPASPPTSSVTWASPGSAVARVVLRAISVHMASSAGASSFLLAKVGMAPGPPGVESRFRCPYMVIKVGMAPGPPGVESRFRCPYMVIKVGMAPGGRRIEV